MSKEIKRNLNIEVTEKDDKLNIVFSQWKDDIPLDEFEVIGVLTASLQMAMKVAITQHPITHEKQAKLLKDVLGNIESSFLSATSFKDLEIETKQR